MTDLTAIVDDLGPAERLALARRQASQRTADRLADKKLCRHVRGPTRRAYGNPVVIKLDLTDLGLRVADAVDQSSIQQ